MQPKQPKPPQIAAPAEQSALDSQLTAIEAERERRKRRGYQSTIVAGETGSPYLSRVLG